VTRRAVRAVVFDLFDTLVRPPPRATVRALLDARGIDPSSPGYDLLLQGVAVGRALHAIGADVDAALAARLTRPEGDLRALLAAVAGPSHAAPLDDLAREAADLQAALLAETSLDPLAEGLLDRLARRGLRLGLISNIDAASRPLIGRLGLSRWFPEPTLSCDAGASKPSPRIFERELGRLDASADAAVMVGDSWTSDVVGALAAGMRAIWIDRGDDAIARMLHHGDVAAFKGRAADGRPRFVDGARRLLEGWLPGRVEDAEDELAGPPPMPPGVRFRALRGVRRCVDLGGVDEALSACEETEEP